MNTISPATGRSNMPSMFVSSSDQPEVKSALQPLQTNQGQVSASQISGLICCNSELASSFQTLKDRTGGMGHPGHYFHKALSNVTQNSRSLSLPSCLDSNKQTVLVVESIECKEEPFLPDPTSANRDQILKDEGIVTNESWFKTWPERGSDKVIFYNDGCSESSKQCKCRIYGVSVHDNQPCSRNCENCIITNSVNCISSINESDLRKNSPSKCVEKLAIGNGIQNSPSLSSSVNNKPSSNCDITKPAKFGHTEQAKSSIPLNELLQNIPLAYSPVTRQLHIIHQNNIHHPHLADGTGKKVDNKISSGRDVANIKNGLLNLESIQEEKVEHSVLNTKNDREQIVVNGCDDTVSYESPRSTLQRIATYDTSLSRTDASSFSSIVSSLSESSPSTNEDTVQGSLLDPDSRSMSQGGHDSLDSGDSSCYFVESGAKPKRRGISGFFSRNVFAWKLSRDGPSSGGAGCSGAPGWKLFGKAASKPRQPETEEIEDMDSAGGCKQYEDVVASSSALILHQRPSNLPAKSQDEEQKHRHEYQRMVEAARKKELKEAKLRKKQLQQQLKQEEQLANAARMWNNEILPKWETMRNSRKAQDLWWQGIPPSVRGKVWRLAIGNDLNITHQLYNICVARAQDRLKAVTDPKEGGEGGMDAGVDNPDKESSVELIRLDISRTFPNLCIFQQGGPYYDILHSLLGAYVCYRPDVGYVQGMSFIAAVLILNLEPADAFVCFANLLNQPCHMAFFRLNETLMQAYYATYNDFFRENLPRLYAHFSESMLSPDLYLLDWLYTVFAKAMPLDVACRVWDVFLRDGEEFLFKTALGVLHLSQDVLLQLDFLHGAQYLTKLPDDLAAHQLFKSIESIRMNVGKLRFGEVLANHIECCREPS
ncbi:TBC1 domain family member 14 [Anabrus simplex]|uniref:TBC1 domain family member 14 n=1 Tax=Anabrus simplex TaxID=316456 RepID=UPI0035A33CA0